LIFFFLLDLSFFFIPLPPLLTMRAVASKLGSCVRMAGAPRLHSKGFARTSVISSVSRPLHVSPPSSSSSYSFPPPVERRIVYEFGRASASREIDNWSSEWMVSGILLSLLGFPKIVGVMALVIYAGELRTRVQSLVVYETIPVGSNVKQMRISASTKRLFGKTVVFDVPAHSVLPAPAPEIGNLSHERGWSFQVPDSRHLLRCDWKGHVRNVEELNRLLGYDVRATVAEHERDQVHIAEPSVTTPNTTTDSHKQH
jgi:hypothetical protein